MNFYDAFAGIGGFHLGLSQLGHKCVGACESDPQTAEQYKANFGIQPDGDIRDIKAIPECDILCGGFPCQAFSIMGNRAGFSGPGGNLIFKLFRLAEAAKPKVVLLENVRNILTFGGAILETIKREFGRLGYTLHYDLLNAGDFGIPQQRKRVYFTAIRKDAGLSYSPPMPSNEAVSVRDILLPDSEVKELAVNPFFFNPEHWKIETGRRYIGKLLRVGFINNKKSQSYRVYSVDGHACSQNGACGSLGANTGLYDINGTIRKLHPIEVRRLMGFPDEHKISKGGLGSIQLGNAVIPKMVRVVAEGISIH